MPNSSEKDEGRLSRIAEAFANAEHYDPALFLHLQTELASASREDKAALRSVYETDSSQPAKFVEATRVEKLKNRILPKRVAERIRLTEARRSLQSQATELPNPEVITSAVSTPPAPEIEVKPDLKLIGSEDEVEVTVSEPVANIREADQASSKIVLDEPVESVEPVAETPKRLARVNKMALLDEDGKKIEAVTGEVNGVDKFDRELTKGSQVENKTIVGDALGHKIHKEENDRIAHDALKDTLEQSLPQRPVIIAEDTGLREGDGEPKSGASDLGVDTAEHETAEEVRVEKELDSLIKKEKNIPKVAPVGIVTDPSQIPSAELEKGAIEEGKSIPITIDPANQKEPDVAGVEKIPGFKNLARERVEAMASGAPEVAEAQPVVSSEVARSQESPVHIDASDAITSPAPEDVPKAEHAEVTLPTEKQLGNGVIGNIKPKPKTKKWSDWIKVWEKKDVTAADIHPASEHRDEDVPVAEEERLAA